MKQDNRLYAIDASMLDCAATVLGGGEPFADVYRALTRRAPRNPNETVTVSVVTLQNILRAALR